MVDWLIEALLLVQFMYTGCVALCMDVCMYVQAACCDSPLLSSIGPLDALGFLDKRGGMDEWEWSAWEVLLCRFEEWGSIDGEQGEDLGWDFGIHGKVEVDMEVWDGFQLWLGVCIEVEDN